MTGIRPLCVYAKSKETEDYYQRTIFRITQYNDYNISFDSRKNLHMHHKLSTRELYVYYGYFLLEKRIR